MKNILFISTIVLTSLNIAFSQSICEAIEFHSDTILIQAPTDESITLKFNYDWEANPSVAYPSYSISLSDTSTIVFHQITVGTFLGQQDSLDFTIVYKNQSIPQGYSVSGNFDIDDPNTEPTLICQFPIVILFDSPLSIDRDVRDFSVQVFPNPFHEGITIDLNPSNIQALYLTDLYAQRVMQLPILAHQEIKLEHLPSGTYFLTIVDQQGQFSCEKLIKYH